MDKKSLKTEVGRRLSLPLVIDGKLHGSRLSAETEPEIIAGMGSCPLSPITWHFRVFELARASHRSMVLLSVICGLDGFDFPGRPELFSWHRRARMATVKQAQAIRLACSVSVHPGSCKFLFCLWDFPKLLQTNIHLD